MASTIPVLSYQPRAVKASVAYPVLAHSCCCFWNSVSGFAHALGRIKPGCGPGPSGYTAFAMILTPSHELIMWSSSRMRGAPGATGAGQTGGNGGLGVGTGVGTFVGA